MKFQSYCEERFLKDELSAVDLLISGFSGNNIDSGDNEMKEDFEKWLCELNNIEYEYKEMFKVCKQEITLEILIKAAWAINRNFGSTKDKHFYIAMGLGSYQISYISGNSLAYKEERFYYKNYDNSEQEALVAALKYIYDSKDK